MYKLSKVQANTFPGLTSALGLLAVARDPENSMMGSWVFNSHLTFHEGGISRLRIQICPAGLSGPQNSPQVTSNLPRQLAYCTKAAFTCIAPPTFASGPTHQWHVTPGRLARKECSPMGSSPFSEMYFCPRALWEILNGRITTVRHIHQLTLAVCQNRGG